MAHHSSSEHLNQTSLDYILVAHRPCSSAAACRQPWGFGIGAPHPTPPHPTPAFSQIWCHGFPFNRKCDWGIVVGTVCCAFGYWHVVWKRRKSDLSRNSAPRKLIIFFPDMSQLFSAARLSNFQFVRIIFWDVGNHVIKSLVGKCWDRKSKDVLWRMGTKRKK